MGKVNFSEDLKRDAVAQITEWGYPVAEVRSRWTSVSIRFTRGRGSARSHLVAMTGTPRSDG